MDTPRTVEAMDTDPPDHEPSGRSRDGKGQFVEMEHTAERDEKAFRLRARGRLLREVATELGYYDESHVRKALARRTEQVLSPAIAEYRAEMDAQLDELYREAMTVLETVHLKVNNGEIVHYETEDGERKPVLDDGPVLAAIREMRGLMERRARLHGLDAPARVQAEVQSVRVTVEGAEDV